MERMSNKRLRVGFLPLAAVGSVLLLAFWLVSGVSADTVLFDSNGFEGYAPGPLQNQYNWLWTGSTLNTATVQSGVVFSGTAAVAVSRVPNADTFWGVQLSGSNGFTPTSQQQISITWQQNPVFNPPSTSFGPYFGVEAYDAKVLGPTGGKAEFGSFGIDATSQTFLLQNYDPDPALTGQIMDTGINANPGWNQMQMILDFSTGQYSVYENGNFLASQYFVDSPSGSLTTVTDVDIFATAANGDAGSLAATGTAYIDNLRVTVVPEPGTVTMLLAGLVSCLGLAWWRRR
jgi:hypothetical protein